VELGKTKGEWIVVPSEAEAGYRCWEGGGGLGERKTRMRGGILNSFEFATSPTAGAGVCHRCV